MHTHNLPPTSADNPDTMRITIDDQHYDVSPDDAEVLADTAEVHEVSSPYIPRSAIVPPAILQDTMIEPTHFMLPNGMPPASARFVTGRLQEWGIATYADIMAAGSTVVFERLSRLRPNQAVGARAIYRAVHAATGRRLPDRAADPEGLRRYYADYTKLPAALALPPGSQPTQLRDLESLFGRPLRTVGDWVASEKLFADALDIDARQPTEAYATFEMASAIMRRLMHDVVPRFLRAGPPAVSAAEYDDAGRASTPGHMQATPLRPWHLEKVGTSAAEATRIIDTLQTLGLYSYADLLVVGADRIVHQAHQAYTNGQRAQLVGPKRLGVLRGAVLDVTGHHLPAASCRPEELAAYFYDVHKAPVSMVLPAGGIRNYAEVRQYDDSEGNLRTIGGWVVPNVIYFAQRRAESYGADSTRLRQAWEIIGDVTVRAGLVWRARERGKLDAGAAATAHFYNVPLSQITQGT